MAPNSPFMQLMGNGSAHYLNPNIYFFKTPRTEEISLLDDLWRSYYCLWNTKKVKLGEISRAAQNPGREQNWGCARCTPLSPMEVNVRCISHAPL